MRGGSSPAASSDRGDAVRVTASVTDVRAASSAGTTKVDGRLHAIFELQDGLVHELGRTILAAVEPDTDAGNQETNVVEAYEAFSRGLLNRQRGDVRVARSRGLAVRARRRRSTRRTRAHSSSSAPPTARRPITCPYPSCVVAAIATLRRAIELQPGSARAWRELGSC